MILFSSFQSKAISSLTGSKVIATLKSTGTFTTQLPWSLTRK